MILVKALQVALARAMIRSAKLLHSGMMNDLLGDAGRKHEASRREMAHLEEVLEGWGAVPDFKTVTEAEAYLKTYEDQLMSGG